MANAIAYVQYDQGKPAGSGYVTLNVRYPGTEPLAAASGTNAQRSMCKMAARAQLEALSRSLPVAVL